MKKSYLFLLFIINSFLLNAQSTQLTVRGYSEGFYRPLTGTMAAVLDPLNQPLVCDSALVELIDTVSFQSFLCLNGVISVDGYITVTLPSNINGNYYFVSLKFRNTFHLLSIDPVRINGTPVLVDLTASQSTCCNFDTTYNVVRSYSGDINNDGAIDGSDFLLLDPDIQNNVTGYVITDLNGDRMVDSLDFNILYNHILFGRSDDYHGGCLTIDVLELEKSKVNVIPNPCREYFTISSSGEFSEMRILLYDILGNVWLDENFIRGQQVEVSYFPKGIYFIRLSGEGRILQGKLMKQ